MSEIVFCIEGKKSVIIGFDALGAWIFKEDDLKTNSIQEENMKFISYQLLLCSYYDSEYLDTTSGYEISEIDLLKYKMQYDFLRRLTFEPCLEDTYYFNAYLNKSIFYKVL